MRPFAFIASLASLLLALIPSPFLLARAEQSPPAPLTFRDVAQEAGLRFTHWNGASPEKYVVETMGSGAAFLDYDNDGWLDVFLVNGGAVPDHPPPHPLRHALFRSNRDGTFTDITRRAGIAGPGQSYGMGVAAADYDNDGWTDLYVTALGRNTLYRNQQDGTFADVTRRAGVAGGGWSTSAAFFDYDRDGDLDLFVARYVDYSYDRNVTCGDPARRIRAYCHPDIYDGVPSLLYRNEGDGTFADVSRKSGIAAHTGKSLGVVAVDLDQDSWLDLYVANDSVRNFLFRNRGDGTFEEVGIPTGAALDEGGRPQAGMGAAAGDYDGDGLPDLVVTNLDREYNNLYRNQGEFFSDDSFQAGTGSSSLPLVGWGTGFFDYDNDGDLDLLVVNGHVIDNVKEFRPHQDYAQPTLLFENTPDGFREVSARHGRALQRPQVSRGAAFGDYDNDGDVDVLVSNTGGSPALLQNDGGDRNHWLALSLEGTESSQDPVGARVKAKLGDSGPTLTRFWVGGGSYLSSNDPRIHLGLGAAQTVARLEILWPSGTTEILENLAAGNFYRVREGEGIVNTLKPAGP